MELQAERSGLSVLKYIRSIRPLLDFGFVPRTLRFLVSERVAARFVIVGRTVVSVRDVPLDAVHHSRHDGLGELQRRGHRRLPLVDCGVDRYVLDVRIVDGQLLVHSFRKDEGNVVPAGESPHRLVPTIRRLSHRDEQAGVGDVEPAHASSVSAMSNSSNDAPAALML